MARTYMHRGTSWGSVLGGWFAAIGAFALFFPLSLVVLGASPAAQARVDDPLIALPVVAALFVSYLIGGYVAGRMALVRRSWHGLMSAIFGLFVAFVVAAAAGSGGGMANSGLLAPIDLSSFGNAVTFGAILGFTAAIFGGWLGGLLSPGVAPVMGEMPPRVVEHPEVVEERPRRGLFARWFRRRPKVVHTESELEETQRRSA